MESAYKQFEESLFSGARARLTELYGETPPDIISERFRYERDVISRNGYAIVFEAGRRLAEGSKQRGFPFELVSAIGSSLIAYLVEISEADPLPPHYRCPKCQHTEFPNVGTAMGIEMPERSCPVCGEKMAGDGFGLAPEMLWNYHCDKTPLLSAAVVDEYAEDAYRILAEFFRDAGMEFGDASFIMDRIIENKELSGSLSDKAPASPKKIAEAEKRMLSDAVKKGGSLILYYYPRGMFLDRIKVNPYYGLDLDFVELVFGSRSLCRLKALEDETGTSGSVFKYGDGDIIFSGLVRAKGIASSIIPEIDDNREGWYSERYLSADEEITCRDDVYSYLLRHGISKETAFDITDAARKGRFSRHHRHYDWIDEMRNAGISAVYIEVLGSIKYLPHRARVISEALTEYRIACLKKRIGE